MLIAAWPYYKDYKNVVGDGQHDADFAIKVTSIFSYKSGRSCAGAEAIQSDECIKSGGLHTNLLSSQVATN